MRLGRSILDAQIGNIEGHVGPALLQVARVAVHGIDVEDRSYRRKDRALEPRGRLAIRIQRRFHVHRRYRVVVVELHVVLARPNDFHRSADFL